MFYLQPQTIKSQRRNLLANDLLLTFAFLFSLLRLSRVKQVSLVDRALLLPLLLKVLGLRAQLLVNSVELPLTLAHVILVHLRNHFLGLFGAEMRFVVLLANHFVVVVPGPSVVYLRFDEHLVLFVVQLQVLLVFHGLCGLKGDVCVELTLLLLSQLLQRHEVVLIPT